MKWRLARDLETRVTVRKEHGRSAVLPRSRLGLEVSLDGDFAFGFLWRGFATGRLNLESLRNMPYSSDVFDNTIQELLFKWRFETYLDIGPGAGKFGRMVKSIVPHWHITAVEIESEYVESFHLREVYDAIILSDALVLLLLTHDTYPIHLASLLFIPTIGLYFATDPVIWGSYYNQFRYIASSIECSGKKQGTGNCVHFHTSCSNIDEIKVSVTVEDLFSLCISMLNDLR
jgi:hypothetical protein